MTMKPLISSLNRLTSHGMLRILWLQDPASAPPPLPGTLSFIPKMGREESEEVKVGTAGPNQKVLLLTVTGTERAEQWSRRKKLC
jgi:hypothetical protein